MSFAELKPRVKTAAFLCLAVLALYIIAIITDYARWIFLFVMFAVVTIAAYEFSGICTVARGIRFKTPIYFLCAVISPLIMLISLLLVDVAPDRDDYFLVYRHTALLVSSGGTFASIIMIILYGLFLGRGDRLVFEQLNREAFIGIFHVGFCGAILMAFVMLTNFQWLLLWLMLVVFSNDIAAYFIGSKLKGPKLAPEISPKKTVSGAIGGIFVGAIVGVLFTYLLGGTSRYSYLDVVILSIIVVVVAQVGDLSKSYIKRLYGVKDTGNILPGHGGLLDRIDGFLMAAPVLYFWLAIF